MNRLRHAIVLVAFLVGVSGCTADPPQVGGDSSAGVTENHPPIVHSLSVVPDPIVRQGVITAVAETKDIDQDEVQLRYRWFVNDRPISGASSAAFSADYVKRGDRLTLEVIPYDGKSEGVPTRVTRVVENTPPVVQTVSLDPLHARAGESIRAVIDGSDVDGDVVRYSYRWTRNNQVVFEGEQDSLETTGFTRDDSVAVFVTPHDATTHGKEVLSQSIVLANRSPKFASTNPASLTQNLFTYTVAAIDPENDPITYSLEIAPEGMVIDGQTGRIQWTIPPALGGTHHVKVVAKDSRDGWVSQEFDVALKPPATS
ncbi:MAG: putative Ig domain-containing protein [Nitrospira sp.]